MKKMLLSILLVLSLCLTLSAPTWATEIDTGEKSASEMSNTGAGEPKAVDTDAPDTPSCSYDSDGFCTDAEHTACYQPAAQADDGYYEIGNAGQLYWFAAKVNGEKTAVNERPAINGRLTADITVNDGTFRADGSYTGGSSATPRAWTPIGTDTVLDVSLSAPCNAYNGTFDGDGHTVSGLYYDRETAEEKFDNIGLFGSVYNATVKDVSLQNSYFGCDAIACVGGIVGRGGNKTNSVVIDGCTVDSTMFCAQVNVDAYGETVAIGGIVGYAGQMFTLQDCATGDAVTFRCSASGSNPYELAIGGIVGYVTANNAEPTIVNCHNRSEVSATNANAGGTANVGGIVGNIVPVSSGSTVLVEGCHNSGMVSAAANAGGIANVGGIVGNIVPVSSGSTVLVEGCHNSGAVSAAANAGGTANVGGIVGNIALDAGGTAEVTVEGCHNSGAVSATAEGKDATGEGEDDTGEGKGSTANAGGIAGAILPAGNSSAVLVKGCHSSSAASATADKFGTANAGGIAGAITTGSGIAIAERCFYLNTDAPADAFASGTTGKTSAQFASGEVCYLLNGETSEGTADDPLVWYQTLGSDSTPVLERTHGTVYASNDSDKHYNNTATNGEAVHVCGTDGRCVTCGKLVCTHTGTDGKPLFGADGKCSKCGYTCEHSTVDETGKCEDCGYQYAVRTNLDSYPWLKSIDDVPFGEDELFAVELYGDTGSGSTFNTVTSRNWGINLRGHTLKSSIDASASNTRSQDFCIESYDDNDVISGTFDGSISYNTDNDKFLSICEGVTVTGKVTINGSANSTGKFYPEEGAIFAGGIKLNVPDKTLEDCLLLDTAFAKKDASGNYTVLVDSGVTEITEEVKVVAHTSHTFTDGKCACGAECPHSTVDETGKCEDCGYQYPVWTNLDSYPWLKSIDDVPFGEGDLHTVELYGDTGSGSTFNTVTSRNLGIDLRGHTLKSSIDASASNTSSQNFHIESCDDNGATSGTFDGSISYNTDNDKFLHICDGVTVTGKVTINGSANSTGKFYPYEGAIFAGGIELNVPGWTLEDRLPSDTALAKKDADGNYTVLVNSSVTEITEEVKVIEHTSHTYGTDGKCGCGAECPHSTVDETGKCEDCGYQYAVLADETWCTSFENALDKNPATIKLYDNVSVADVLRLDDRTLTIDLNGHTLTSKDGIDIGVYTSSPKVQITITNTDTEKVGTVDGRISLSLDDVKLTINGNVTVTGAVGGNSEYDLSDYPVRLGVGVTIEGGLEVAMPDHGMDRCLDPNTAFAVKDTKTGEYTEIISSNTISIEEPVKVVEHTSHTFTDGKCACGYSCEHEGGFNADTGKCESCGKQKAVKRTLESTTAWFDTIDAALAGLDSMATVRLDLYEDVSAGAVSANGLNLTLSLNGHTLTANITVAGGGLLLANDNASTGGKLAGTVTNDGTGGMFSTYGDVTISGLVTLAGGDSFAVGTKLEGGAKTVAAGGTLAEHLNSGAAFARSEAGGIAGETIVDGSVTELTGALKVIAHASHSYASTGKCACGAECPHSTINANTGKCADCGKQKAVKRTLGVGEDSTTAWFDTVDAALAGLDSMAIVRLDLYEDVSADAVSAGGLNLTLSLNGHTLTANVTAGGTARFENGTVDGTITASAGSTLLFGENVRVNGRVTVNVSASIAAGTIFAGGIEISGAGRTLMDILPDGTAFAKQGKLAYDTVVSAATVSIAEDVMLIPHTAHTALSDPTHCTCGRAVAAKLSEVNATSATYYTTIGDALTALNAWEGETPSLTVLANGSIPAGTTVTHLGYLQLNGKTVTGDLTIDISTAIHSLVVRGASGSKLDGTVTVRSGGLIFNRATGTTIEGVVVDGANAKVSTGRDAGTINALTVNGGSVSLSAGTFGTITVTADGMDIGDLLAEGYGIKLTDGTWLDQTAAQTTLTDVTVQELPVMVTSLGGNVRLTYGDSLSVTANIDPESAAGVQYEWLVNGTSVTGVTGTSYAAGVVDAGTYTVTCKATLDGYTSTATKTFTVAKKTLQGENFTQPKALTDALTYNGSAQALVAAGAVDGGATIRYSLDKSTWTSTVPTATDAGDYTVYWYVDGGTNYTDFYIGGEPFEIEVSIGQLSLADTADYSAPTARSGLAFSERAHQLIGGAVTPSSVTAYYSLDQTSWTTDASTLTRTDAGDYPVYWYVDGGTNYASIASRTAPNTLTAHIAPLELMIADVRIEPKYYDGTTAAEVVFEFRTGDGMGYRPDSSGYTVDAQFDSARVGGNIPVVIKLTITSDNYILKGGTKTYTKDDGFGEIRKAAAPRLTDGSLSLVYTKTTGTFDLAALGIPADADAVGCTPGTLPAGVESARVDGTTLTVTLASGGEAGDTFTLPLTVYSENYNDAEANVVITLIAKTDRALAVTMDGWTFGGTASAPRYDAPENAQSLRVQYKARGAADATYTAAVPTNAGEYTVRVSCETETESWSGSADFTVAAARLTGVSVQQSGMLAYNGDAQTVQVTAEATALGGETVRFTYSMSEDGVYGAMPQLADADDYTVYYEASAANHIAVRGSFTVTIAQATPHITNARADVTYGQSVAGSDITAETGGVAGSFQWKDVSSYGDASNGAKTLFARFVPTDSRNYETIESVAVSVTVAKAVYSGEAIEAAASIFVGQTRRGVIVDLSDLLRSIAGAEVNGAAEDTATDPYDLVENVEVLTANRVRFDLNGGSDGAHEGVIDVNISSTNYQDITAHIVVTSIAKTDVSARVSFTGGTLPYTGSALTYERASVSGLTGGSWTYTYAAASDTASLSDGKPLTAGSYTVTAFYEDAENYAEVSVTLTVAKATPTGAPRYTAITASGKTLADAALAADDFSTAGTVAWVDANGAPLAPETEVTANTSYLWRFTPDDTANYESLTGSIRLWSRSSSGSSTSITVPVSSDSGSVKVDASVSGSTARVSVSDQQLDAVAADGAGSVTVDVSGLKRVTSAVIPAKVVETVDAADDTGLTVALASGSVSLDETALTSAAADAKGRDVTVSIVSVPTDKLPTAVRNAIGMDTTVVAVVDVDLTVGGAKLSDFHGGKLTIRIPYTPKAGEDTSRLAVWFVRDDGTIENKGGRYDAAQGCFVFETEHLSQYLLVYGGTAFADVPADAYYASAVNWAVAQGITNGVDDTHFAPDLSCTRAQIVTFLYRAAGSPAVEVSGAFEDVAADAYYAKAVAWAVAQGITNGTSAARFSPDETCTRAQAVVFLFRYAAANGMSAVTMQELVSGYGDAGSVPGYALPAFNWALARGIVQGANGELMPNDTCTRAQIVTLLQRTMG